MQHFQVSKQEVSRSQRVAFFASPSNAPVCLLESDRFAKTFLSCAHSESLESSYLTHSGLGVNKNYHAENSPLPSGSEGNGSVMFWVVLVPKALGISLSQMPSEPQAFLYVALDEIMTFMKYFTILNLLSRQQKLVMLSSSNRFIK